MISERYSFTRAFLAATESSHTIPGTACCSRAAASERLAVDLGLEDAFCDLRHSRGLSGVTESESVSVSETSRSLIALRLRADSVSPSVARSKRSFALEVSRSVERLPDDGRELRRGFSSGQTRGLGLRLKRLNGNHGKAECFFLGVIHRSGSLSVCVDPSRISTVFFESPVP